MNKSKYRFCVYRIKNKINGNFYIGSSSNVKKRWETHRRNISAYQPGKNINNSFDLPFLMKMDIEGGNLLWTTLISRSCGILKPQKKCSNASKNSWIAFGIQNIATTATLKSLIHQFTTSWWPGIWSHFHISSTELEKRSKTICIYPEAQP